MVGGLPLEKKPPWNYKAPFSPIDVIEEYTRPARIKENGNIKAVKALTGLINFELRFHEKREILIKPPVEMMAEELLFLFFIANFFAC